LTEHFFTCISAKPKQQEEIEELKDFAASRGFDSKLQPWDVDYYRRKHRMSLYKYKYLIVCKELRLPGDHILILLN